MSDTELKRMHLLQERHEKMSDTIEKMKQRITDALDDLDGICEELIKLENIITQRNSSLNKRIYNFTTLLNENDRRAEKPWRQTTPEVLLDVIDKINCRIQALEDYNTEDH